MKVFVKNFSKIKKNSPYFIFLFLALFFTPFPAFAFWETLKNAVLAVPFLIVSAILILFVLLTGALAIICSKILDVVISPSFVSLSYTNPKTNPIIAAGLSITQSFVGMILVSVLVYTALAIALRINEAQAKKTLARVIIVALLVNFAPVFCGLVIDGANIVMSPFLMALQEGVSGWLSQAISSWMDFVIHQIWDQATKITTALGVIMMGVTQIIIHISLAIAFLLYALIFLLRYIAIWILVILAPIAFCAWAVSPVGAPPEREIGFPITIFVSAIASLFQKFWDKWLNQFIEWSIIGIPLAFFLYLAVSNFSVLVNNFQFKTQTGIAGIDSQTVSYFNEVFPYFVIVAFLYLGFAVGLETGAMGTQGIIKGARAARKTVTTMTAATAGGAMVAGAVTTGKLGVTTGKLGGKLGDTLFGEWFRRGRSVYQLERKYETPPIKALWRGIKGGARAQVKVWKSWPGVTKEKLRKSSFKGILKGVAIEAAKSPITVTRGAMKFIKGPGKSGYHAGKGIYKGLKYVTEKYRKITSSSKQ
jgi:hypothetical protein